MQIVSTSAPTREMLAVPSPAAPALQVVRDAVSALPGIGLERINAKAELQDRVDTKFIAKPEVLTALIGELDAQLEVLDIAGRRSFSYDSIYFDTPQLRTYREHLQGRRRRFKIRTRTYIDSDFTVLEIKTKGLRGRTEKVRISHAADPQELDTTGRQFSTEILQQYGIRDAAACVAQLRPTVRTAYRRITLVGRYRPFRLTCDAVLGCADERAGVLTLDDRVLIEAKTAGDRDPVIGQLRRLGVRPVKMSKYCAGIGMLKSQVPSNPWRPVIKRHLHPQTV